MSGKIDNQSFYAEVAQKFHQAIRDHGITKSEAARVLGISRETLYKYLNAHHAPKSAVLRKACSAWGITLSYRGLEFDSSAFAQPAKLSVNKEKQLSLFKVLESINDQSLEVTVIRKTRKTIELKVSVKFAS
jgi:transcriptional regulator with XRE-family HTH domain